MKEQQKITLDINELGELSKKANLAGMIARALLRMHTEKKPLEEVAKLEEQSAIPNIIATKLTEIHTLLVRLNDEISAREVSSELEDILRVMKNLEFKSFKGGI
ncbi:MAG: hypothetical protein ACTTH5_07455 [Wolinella sp.]